MVKKNNSQCEQCLYFIYASTDSTSDSSMILHRTRLHSCQSKESYNKGQPYTYDFDFACHVAFDQSKLSNKQNRICSELTPSIKDLTHFIFLYDFDFDFDENIATN
jgi:hypothetical protein